jgi:hypothetical protein
MLSQRLHSRSVGILLALVVAAVPAISRAAESGKPAELIGTWRGTSTCSDRVAAPACKDETVVYEFTKGTDAGIVHWEADKVVGGKREPMGGFDLAYDATEQCWKAEFVSPRVRMVWRVVVAGDRLTGSATLLPGGEKVRRIEAKRN